MTPAPTTLNEPVVTAPRRKRRTVTAAFAVIAAAALIATACVPSDFVKHTSGQYWTWFAPQSWGASYGANGIDISNNIGSQQVGMGFAPIGCGSGATVQDANRNFFNSMRATVRDGSGLTQWQTLSASTPRLMPAAYGANYYRQDIRFQGRAPNGTLIRGEGELDVQYTGFFPGCLYINRLRTAPSSQFSGVIDRLRATQNSINYFPPGV